MLFSLYLRALLQLCSEFPLQFSAAELKHSKHELFGLAFDKIEKEGFEQATRRGNEVASYLKKNGWDYIAKKT